MSKREIRLYLEDIKEALERIEEYTVGLTLEDFRKDTKTKDAVIRNISVLGEALNNLPEEIKSRHPEMPWHEAVGMRNKIIHEYFGIDDEILWKTIKEDLPQLKKQIMVLMK